MMIALKVIIGISIVLLLLFIILIILFITNKDSIIICKNDGKPVVNIVPLKEEKETAKEGDSEQDTLSSE